MSNSVEYEIAMDAHREAEELALKTYTHAEVDEKTKSIKIHYVTMLQEKDRLNSFIITDLNLRLELAEFEARMFRKYKHLDLEKLETDYDYYDCVFMEHFEMNYHNDETTEKHRLEGVEFMKMFEKPEKTSDDEW
tara:strand:- start:118 stop:522 length:405 start_codon:yes stop_codon:yes gene_type:complete